MKRRDFLKAAGFAAVGLAAGGALNLDKAFAGSRSRQPKSNQNSRWCRLSRQSILYQTH